MNAQTRMVGATSIWEHSQRRIKMSGNWGGRAKLWVDSVTAATDTAQMENPWLIQNLYLLNKTSVFKHSWVDHFFQHGAIDTQCSTLTHRNTATQIHFWRLFPSSLVINVLISNHLVQVVSPSQVILSVAPQLQLCFTFALKWANLFHSLKLHYFSRWKEKVWITPCAVWTIPSV